MKVCQSGDVDDAKVPNIPEVKVNRLRCVVCAARHLILWSDESYNPTFK